MSDILKNLNDEQMEAVTHKSGPLMIVAGAGTGKTTVMTRRIAWLIEQEHARPDEILALTFTDRAAAEMEERVDRLLPFGYVDLWISTFHAFCQRVLQEHGIDIGIANDAQLLTEVDAWLLVRQNFDKFELDYYKPLGNPTKFVRAMLTHFSRAKDEGVDAKEYRRHIEKQKDLDPDDKARLKELAHAYEVYEGLLHENNALDFGGLILQVLRLLKERPAILKKYQEQFKYIIVDEFQDTNWTQYEIVKMLAGKHNNIAIVGDDDQAIYKFRGASMSNILEFEADYPKTHKIVLTKNYRSQQGILDEAYKFIAQNEGRLEAKLKKTHGLSKQLESQIVGDGIVRHIHAADIESEVRSVVDEIRALKEETECNWNDIAVLVRANDSAEPFLIAMDMDNVPYMFMALSGLYRKPIVLDAISLLRAVDNPYDSPSVYRLLSHPVIGIPERDLVSLSHLARRKGVSMAEAMTQGARQMSPEGAQRIKELSDVLQSIRSYAKRRNALEVFAEALKQSGLYGAVLQLDEEEQYEQSSYLQQFYERVRRYIQTSEHIDLHSFLSEFEHERASGEEGALGTSDQAGPDEVRVMTLHGAKGLEFRFVFIVNLVDRRFPAQRRSDPIPLPEGMYKHDTSEIDEHLEEERRLMYVGMTRAKERLYLTSADDYGGSRMKKLSRFLHEMEYEKPEDPVKHDTGLFSERKVQDRLLAAGSKLPVPKAFSFTQLTAYDHCPLQYKFAHVLKIPTFGSAAMSFGKTMHNTLQTFFERMVKESPNGQVKLLEDGEEATMPSKDELLEIYGGAWLDDWYQSSSQREKYREEGRIALEAYWDELQVEKPQPLFLERGFTVKIDDIVVRGRIDRIDRIEGGVEIIDYKTGTPKTDGKLTDSDKMQLLLYQLAAREIFGLEPAKLTFHYLKDSSRVSFLGTEDDIIELKQKIRDYVGGVRGGKFDPTPGFMCRYCDFRDICPFRSS